MADLGLKNCSSGPKAAIFGVKQPWKTFGMAKRKKTVGTLHVQLHLLVSTSLLRPSNSMICPRKGQRRPPQASNADSHKPRTGHIFRYMAQNVIPRAPSPPATSHFFWFAPLIIAQTDAWTPIPSPTRLRQAASSSPRSGGCPNGTTLSTKRKKMTFLHNDPRPCAAPREVFVWTVLSLWWPILSLEKYPSALK